MCLRAGGFRTHLQSASRVERCGVASATSGRRHVRFLSESTKTTKTHEEELQAQQLFDARGESLKGMT